MGKMYAECHKCGKKGHIHPDCPMHLEKVKSGQIKPPFRRAGPRKPPGLPKPRRDFSKDPKVKAFWIATFNAMFGEDNEDKKVEGNDTEDNNDETADKDMRSFLSMVGSLKE